MVQAVSVQPSTVAPAFTFQPATEADFPALVSLRIQAMRDSLERIGRFDPERAAQRFRSTFRPDDTRLIRVGDAMAGCVARWPQDDAVRIEHFYLAPAFQRRGLGAAVLRRVFAEAGVAATRVTRFRVAALRDSDANRFYARHGFVLLSQGEWDAEYEREHKPEHKREGAHAPDAAAPFA